MDVLFTHASEHGYEVDLNAVDKLGLTPLSIAAEFNRVTVLQHLIEKGPNLDTVDLDGDTLLHNAAAHRSHEAVRLLLGIGTGTGFKPPEVKERYRAVNKPRGWGILHYIANFGDVEMMRIFEGLEMRGLPDLETVKDLQGRTAWEIFEARVRNSNSAGCEDGGEEGEDKGNDCQSSDDEFFDVQEY